MKCLNKQNCAGKPIKQINRHSMKLDPSPFMMIKRGQKTIELRLFDEKRRLIRIGDEIVFTDKSSGETLSVTVENIHRFASFEELYNSLPLLKCGYTIDNINAADLSDMEEYYSPEEQKAYGVVGIEISKN